MKSKVTTYLLIASVLIVWGIIAWKLFVPSRVETYSVPASALGVATGESSDTLRLNYPDPFLKREALQTETNSPSETAVLETQSLEIIREDCPIVYIGYIRQGRNIDCIVKSDGLHHSITTGGIVNGFRLANIYPDSLIFTKDGLSYTINLSQ